MKTKKPLTRKPYVWKQKDSTKRKGLFDHLKSEKKGLFDHFKKESKDEESNRIREELKIWFIENDILSCELNLEGCTQASNFGWTWSFAHSEKRGDIVAQKIDPIERDRQMREVCYACGNCHAWIEKISNKERFDGKPKMRDYVLQAIQNRVDKNENNL